MEGAFPGELVQRRMAGLLPLRAVVNLEVLGDIAAGYDAVGVSDPESRLLQTGGVAPEVHHGSDVDPVGEHGGEAGVGRHVLDDRHRYRADTLDVAPLLSLRVTASQSSDVDHGDHLDPQSAAAPGAGLGGSWVLGRRRRVGEG